jgi:hypothetical protein
MALVHYDALKDEKARAQIAVLTSGYQDKSEYFVDTLARGMARIAAAHYPNPVIVRMSDFKTNEYARLIGGAAFEPAEENPMLGWRGASRYYSDGYRDGFALECRAVKRARADRAYKYRRDDSLLPQPRRSRSRAGGNGAAWPYPRQGARSLRDVRDTVQRHSRDGIRGTLRRFFDRFPTTSRSWCLESTATMRRSRRYSTSVTTP